MAKHWGPPEWIYYLLRKIIPLLIIEPPKNRLNFPQISRKFESPGVIKYILGSPASMLMYTFLPCVCRGVEKLPLFVAAESRPVISLWRPCPCCPLVSRLSPCTF